jgi:hypothetical protein
LPTPGGPYTSVTCPRARPPRPATSACPAVPWRRRTSSSCSKPVERDRGPRARRVCSACDADTVANLSVFSAKLVIGGTRHFRALGSSFLGFLTRGRGQIRAAFAGHWARRWAGGETPLLDRPLRALLVAGFMACARVLLNTRCLEVRHRWSKVWRFWRGSSLASPNRELGRTSIFIWRLK